MDKFTQIKNQRVPGECRDCSVISAAIAGRVSYKVAHAALKAQGRKDRGGAYTFQSVEALQSLGCTVERLQFGPQPNGNGWTAASIGRRFPRGYYLVTFRGHIAAMVNGKLEDWTAGRRHKVLGVYKVTVPRGSRS